LGVFDFLLHRSPVKPASPRQLNHVRFECRSRFKQPSASDRHQEKRRNNGMEVRFPTVKCSDETRTPCKQGYRLHIITLRGLSVQSEGQEGRQRYGKHNPKGALLNLCAPRGAAFASQTQGSASRRRIRCGCLHTQP
jgi:hypothetical protein